MVLRGLGDGFGVVLGWFKRGGHCGECKKMQKNCKNMQYYLHIWKKSSIFAPDLGIVPSVII